MQSKKLFAGIPNQPPTNRIKRLVIRSGRYFALLLIMVLLASHINTNPKIGKSDVEFYSRETEQLIELQARLLIDANTLSGDKTIGYYLNNLVAQFYQIRNFEPAWTLNYQVSQNYNSLIAILDSAYYLGFPADFFKTSELKKLQKDFIASSKGNSLQKRIDFELQASREMFRMLIFIHMGIIQSDTSRMLTNFTNHLPQMVNNALENQKLFTVVTNLQPTTNEYNSIIKSIPSFLNVLNEVNNLNDSLVSNRILSKSLKYIGGIELPDSTDRDFRELAISRFQESNFLQVTGKLDQKTRSKLVRLIQYRYLQLCINLDRLRKIDNTEDDYLFVNIPEFKLHLIEKNKETHAINVIVGTEETPTPQLSSKVERIIINPDWTVPRSIANREMIARIKQDSTYLQKHGFIVVDGKEHPVDAAQIDWSGDNPLGSDYWIRQVNSKNNALGQVKFDFQNDHQVYLHDTQGKHLFNKNKRTFSHGCIRVQNPLDLAQLLIDNYCSNSKDLNIEEVAGKKQTRVIELEKKVAIHIQYISCTANEKGDIIFFEDVYELDKDAILTLFANLPV